MNKGRPSEANAPFLPNALNLACISDISLVWTVSHTHAQSLWVMLYLLLSILPTASPDTTFNMSNFSSSIPTDLPHLREGNILCYRCP